MNTGSVDEREWAVVARERSMLLLERADARREPASSHSVSFRLPRLPVVLDLVRHDLRRWLEGEGLAPDAVADVTLACSEACANAMEHPRSPLRAAFDLNVRLQRRRVEIVVRDYGSWTAGGSADGEWRGRGLDIIRALMDEVEVEHTALGTRVTMRKRVDLRA